MPHFDDFRDRIGINPNRFDDRFVKFTIVMKRQDTLLIFGVVEDSRLQIEFADTLTSFTAILTFHPMRLVPKL